MARRLLLLALMVVLVLGIALVRWDPTGEYSEFCSLEGLLDEPPPGWEFDKDHNNDCAWTLFNESGERAPDDLYRDAPIDPPPDYPYDWDELGWVLVVAATIGGAAVWPDSQLPPTSDRTAGDEPAV